MRKDFTSRKRVILGLVGLLVLADCGLAAYSWWQASTPRTPQQQLDRESMQIKLWRSDIERARAIEHGMPDTQKDCDKFEQSLLPSNTGYSAVSQELGAIARKTGLQFSSTNYHQKDIASRKLTEVDLEVAISGDYASVVKFLNGLQRSENVYVVDGLALSSESQAQGSPSALRLSLRMRTYFRTIG
jgi:Tfp pilus assembly protein PilO